MEAQQEIEIALEKAKPTYDYLRELLKNIPDKYFRSPPKMEMNLEERLLNIKTLKEMGKELDSSLINDAHILAEAHYLPAKEFFLDGLNEPSFSWREACVIFLGHHYDLEEKYLKKFAN